MTDRTAINGRLHGDEDSFHAAEWDDTLLVTDRAHRPWLAWQTEYGDWYAVSPRGEDDVDPGKDRWRPIGPHPIESLTFPIRCVRVTDAVAGVRE